MVWSFESSEYFTGEKALSRVKRDDNMMNWFAGLATQVRSLDMEESQATSTGRKIQGLIAGLSHTLSFISDCSFWCVTHIPLIYHTHTPPVCHTHPTRLSHISYSSTTHILVATMHISLLPPYTYPCCHLQLWRMSNNSKA